MKALFLLVISISFGSCLPQSDQSVAEKKQPNFLFILADDLGYHDLSCMGSTYYETPNIDRIANEGVVFTGGYAACQVCSPSRASIMTGKFPSRHGITDWIGAKTGEDWRKAGRYNKLLPPEYVHTLSKEYVTLPEAMKEGGYKTFFAGKWHLGQEGSWPTDHGFDINKGGWDKGSPMGGYYAPWDNPNLESTTDGESLTMRLAKETSNFISENKEEPFFAFLSFYAVHGPIQTTEDKWKKYRDKAEAQGIKDHGFEMSKFLPIRQVQDNPIYAGLLETMDDAVGRVLNTLDELGLAENTIVIFTSDNGGVAAGDAFATSNLPLRGGKGYQYEGGIRAPYFIRAPQRIKAGSKIETPVTGTDFYPTILDIAGLSLKPEEHQDGKSLLPIIKGEKLDARPLVWHYPHYGNQGGEPSSIIRKGEWKLIHYYEEDREELFNLTSDAKELIDIAENHPEKVKQLDAELFEILNATGARFPTKDPLYNAISEKAYLTKIENERLPRLERQRLEFLAKDFNPKNSWWDSNLTMD
ncbi:MAG: arylsulfatase A-like enzyme [Saprospiraceae bacterium]|jgi:arylsulfatase A-like enzyme